MNQDLYINPSDYLNRVVHVYGNYVLTIAGSSTKHCIEYVVGVHV